MQKKKRSLTITAVLLLCILLGGGIWLQQSRIPLQEQPESRVQIVTTIFPLADIIQNLGGEFVQVTTLLPAGASPHTYEPSVAQVKAVSQADLLVYVGGGLDDWVLKTAAAADKKHVTVEVLDYLTDFLLPVEGATGARAAEGKQLAGEKLAGEHDHFNFRFDPHVWTDPLLVKDEIAPALAVVLAGLQPVNEKQFQHNLEDFQAELELLHADIAAELHDFAGKRFITYHSSWNYFAARYGLGKPVHVEAFPGQEPTVKWLTELVGLARELGVKVVFAEPQLSSKAATVIAAEIGGRVLILDPLGGTGLPGRDSYNDLMRYNLAVLLEGLQ